MERVRSIPIASIQEESRRKGNLEGLDPTMHMGNGSSHPAHSLFNAKRRPSESGLNRSILGEEGFPRLFRTGKWGAFVAPGRELPTTAARKRDAA